MTAEQESQQSQSTSPGFLFSFRGRISRVQFLIGLGVITALTFCLVVTTERFMRGGFDMLLPVMILSLIAVAWIHSAIVIQRVRDAGHPGWYYFIFGPGPFLLLLSTEFAQLQGAT